MKIDKLVIVAFGAIVLGLGLNRKAFADPYSCWGSYDSMGNCLCNDGSVADGNNMCDAGDVAVIDDSQNALPDENYTPDQWIVHHQGCTYVRIPDGDRVCVALNCPGKAPVGTCYDQAPIKQSPMQGGGCDAQGRCRV